jgi:hypothetical protein
MELESHRFVRLARPDGREARGRLLTVLSCEILDSQDRTDIEIAIFFDITRLLIEQADHGARRAFSRKVAGRPNCPRDILLRLAGDDISIAEPVLIHAVRLDEADLLDLATRRGAAHRAAIALRRDLSPVLARALLQAGEREVFLRLCANHTVVLDPELLHAFHRRAETDDGLREILGTRPELHDARAASGEIDRRNARRPAAASGGDDVADLIAALDAGRATLDVVVVELADADRQADLAAVFGRLSGIDPTGVLRVMVRRDADGIATLAGGLGLGEASYARIVELRRRRLGFSATQARWEREAFAGLDRADARARLDRADTRRRAG